MTNGFEQQARQVTSAILSTEPRPQWERSLSVHEECPSLGDTIDKIADWKMKSTTDHLVDFEA